MEVLTSVYGLHRREVLRHGEEFQLGKVQLKIDVYRRKGGSPPYDFSLYRKEENEKYESIWRFISGSDWDNDDMEMLFRHVVRTYEDHLYNGQPASHPQTIPSAGIVPKREYKPGDIPPAGLPNG